VGQGSTRRARSGPIPHDRAVLQGGVLPRAAGSIARCVGSGWRVACTIRGQCTTAILVDTATQAVDRLVRRIVETVHPLRVILFGSCVRGHARPDSDIDLLVVMPEGTHRRRTAQRLYQEIQDAGVAFDVVVATPSDLHKHKETPGYVYKTILQEGKDIYVAQ
jgi:predicted nucleotidyltransferase